LAQLVGCAFLWHSQQAERIPQADVSLVVLAPSVNEAIRDELRCLGWQISWHRLGQLSLALPAGGELRDTIGRR
jgi:hypothetical protein